MASDEGSENHFFGKNSIIKPLKKSRLKKSGTSNSPRYCASDIGLQAIEESPRIT
jgi:hypothetical protein